MVAIMINIIMDIIDEVATIIVEEITTEETALSIEENLVAMFISVENT